MEYFVNKNAYLEACNKYGIWYKKKVNYCEILLKLQ